MGIVFTNFLIAIFAEANVLHSFIEIGAKFQALTPSFMKVFFESSEKLDTGNVPLVIDLIDLTSGPASIRLCFPFFFSVVGRISSLEQKT